jgi:hypothetical protein
MWGTLAGKVLTRRTGSGYKVKGVKTFDPMREDAFGYIIPAVFSLEI